MTEDSNPAQIGDPAISPRCWRSNLPDGRSAHGRPSLLLWPHSSCAAV